MDIVDYQKLMKQWEEIQDRLAIAKPGSDDWFDLQKASAFTQKQLLELHDAELKTSDQKLKEALASQEHLDRVDKMQQEKKIQKWANLVKIGCTIFNGLAIFGSMYAKDRIENGDPEHPRILGKIDEWTKKFFPRT